LGWLKRPPVTILVRDQRIRFTVGYIQLNVAFRCAGGDPKSDLLRLCGRDYLDTDVHQLFFRRHFTRLDSFHEWALFRLAGHNRGSDLPPFSIAARVRKSSPPSCLLSP